MTIPKLCYAPIALAMVALLTCSSGSNAEPNQSPAPVANAESSDDVLNKKVLSLPPGSFRNLASLLYAVDLATISTSDEDVSRAAISPIVGKDQKITMAELFETIARQTGTTCKYHEASKTWNFDPPAMPLPYTLKIAKGWRQEERGLYTSYIPPIAPVGMDIYMFGRFKGLDDNQLNSIRDKNALWFANRMSPEVAIKDMESKIVGGVEALYFKAKAPVENRQWRQWALVKNGQIFLIVSAVDDKNESKLVPDVEAMVSSFQVVEPGVPAPGY